MYDSELLRQCCKNLQRNQYPTAFLEKHWFSLGTLKRSSLPQRFR
jgi:hypothetical protein